MTRSGLALRRTSAAACAAVVVITLAGCENKTADERPAATLLYRPVEGRISGLPYAEPPRGRKAATLPNLRHVTSLYAQPEALQARAAMITGDVRRASQLFEKLTSGGNRSARNWSDYAAALHAEAAPDDVLQLSTALAATDRALDLAPSSAEGLFNRAIILEALSLRGAAAAAYTTYLGVDASSQWAEEVRTRLQRLESARTRTASWQEAIYDLRRAADAGDALFINDIAIAFPQDARSWAEGPFLTEWAERVLEGRQNEGGAMLMLCRVIGRTLETVRKESMLADAVRAIDAAENPEPLARAHVAYSLGRRAYAVRDLASTLRALEEARRLFEAHDSPMALMAGYYLAQAARDAGEAARSESIGRDVAARTSERYRALSALNQWARAVSAADAGLSKEAVVSYRAAGAVFSALGEERHATWMRHATIGLLAASGDSTEAWRLRYASMADAAEAGDDSRLALMTYEAARDAAIAGRWDIAHALLNASIETPQQGVHLRTEAMAWRIVAAKRVGMHRTAAADLRALHAAESRADALYIVEALIADNDAEAVRLLTQRLNASQNLGNTTPIAQLLVERARRLLSMRQDASAQEDLERAVALLERDRGPAVTISMRDAVLGSASEAYGMLADTLDARGETKRALSVLQSYRTRESRLSAGRHVIDETHGTIPAGTLVITYGVFAERLVIYANQSTSFTRLVVPVKASTIKRLVTELDDAISDDEERRIKITSRALSRILIEPIATLRRSADKIVFVNDPALLRLPFAALPSDDERYLIESHEVITTPGLAWYLRALQRKSSTSKALLSVGNPLTDGRLTSLSAAEEEAKEIATLYPSRALLVGAAATEDRVIGALAYCDAAHFAVHSNSGLGLATPPHLVLTKGKNDDGKLTATEIAALQLQGIRTVVLAGCRTAVSSPGEGTGSLVDAFLAAGAGSVVGTLWEIKDAQTREISTALHRALREKATPAAALRAVQVSMIRRGRPTRAWASLQLYGSGS